MSATDKLFRHGRSQAVRPPKAFRFEGAEVRVTRVGDRVLLKLANSTRAASGDGGARPQLPM